MNCMNSYSLMHTRLLRDYTEGFPECVLSAVPSFHMQLMTEGVTHSRAVLFTYCCWFLPEIHNSAEPERLVSSIFTFCSVPFLFIVVEFFGYYQVVHSSSDCLCHWLKKNSYCYNRAVQMVNTSSLSLVPAPSAHFTG